MEFVKGGSLKDLIVNRRREGIKFSDIEASNVMKSIMSAVAYMHNNNIVHRDLKPGNLPTSSDIA
jgi:serine/threonine protein kinase